MCDLTRNRDVAIEEFFEDYQRNENNNIMSSHLYILFCVEVSSVCSTCSICMSPRRVNKVEHTLGN